MSKSKNLWQHKKPGKTDPDPIAQAVKVRMMAANTNPYVLSASTGVTYNTLHRWLTGRGGMRSEPLARVLKALDLHIAVK